MGCHPKNSGRLVLQKIIVQNLGGPTYIGGFWGLGFISSGTLVELCGFGISLPRFGR